MTRGKHTWKGLRIRSYQHTIDDWCKCFLVRAPRIKYHPNALSAVPKTNKHYTTTTLEWVLNVCVDNIICIRAAINQWERLHTHTHTWAGYTVLICLPICSEDILRGPDPLEAFICSGVLDLVYPIAQTQTLWFNWCNRGGRASRSITISTTAINLCCCRRWRLRRWRRWSHTHIE